MLVRNVDNTTNDLLLHKDLSNCAWKLRDAMRRKTKLKCAQNVHDEMVSFLIFTAFCLEAYINFIGWKIFKNEWIDQDNLHNKIIRIISILELELDWDVRPLASAAQISEVRKNLADKKPGKLVFNQSMEFTDCHNNIFISPQIVEAWHDDIESLWDTIKDAAVIHEAQLSTINRY